MPRVIMPLPTGVHLLDVSGPSQIFSSAAQLRGGWELVFVTSAGGVRSHQGLRLTGEPQWPTDSTPRDLVLVPGWHVTADDPMRVPLPDSVISRLASHHAGGGVVGSVCAGALALGAAGLLDGRRCTTHHAVQRRLAAAYPRATVVQDVLFTEDDRVVTSAGIASGIDLALHLVAQHDGPQTAARVARDTVVYARRNGDDPQDSVLIETRHHLDDAVHRVQDVIDERFAERLSLLHLSSAAGVSERTLTRAFRAATGTTPLRYQQTIRLERANRLIGGGSTVEAAARAVGFEDGRMLRRLRERASGSTADRR
ncbi:DJ-1/PfpI family protein [Luteipulveratus sp. YIM 133132]|uniref:GlxA family transcriptional regulator n=1 Tax=Luteipulveratus flavus TaxID=3031728 RepID=UPI0023B1D5EC|nr:DJ-1/PfpI family protein [Luteipulveratus sp. YIM 133132]MDE9367444.1 DJ-1/PfpI family protein [Luteipulveratus sp. YIM 133132]